jgi:hypothetical protein
MEFKIQNKYHILLSTLFKLFGISSLPAQGFQDGGLAVVEGLEGFVKYAVPFHGVPVPLSAHRADHQVVRHVTSAGNSVKIKI